MGLRTPLDRYTLGPVSGNTLEGSSDLDGLEQEEAMLWDSKANMECCGIFAHEFYSRKLKTSCKLTI